MELLGVGAARLHERQRSVDLAREALVSLPCRALGDEVLIPRVDLMQVGVAAVRERAAQVQGDRRAVVCVEQPRRVRSARRRREVEAVDGLAAVGGQLGSVARLGGERSRLRELPRHPADLHHRDACRVREHHRHLQERLELVAHGIGRRPGEGLRAVAALQEERVALRHGAEALLELVALAGEDQRRLLGKLGGRRRYLSVVRPVRLLGDRKAAPGVEVVGCGGGCGHRSKARRWGTGSARRSTARLTSGGRDDCAGY